MEVATAAAHNSYGSSFNLDSRSSYAHCSSTHSTGTCSSSLSVSSGSRACSWKKSRIGCRACSWKKSRIGCAPRTRQDDFVVSEEKERIRLIEKTNSVDEVPTEYSVGPVDKNIQGRQSHTSSLVKLVVFWILAAVIFGIGLGVKDGTEKASEFFAGEL